MARVKRAVHSKKKHKAVLKQAKGYYGNKSRSFRAANEQVMHSGNYAFRDRREKDNLDVSGFNVLMQLVGFMGRLTVSL